jgi:N utilization substance protein B
MSDERTPKSSEDDAGKGRRGSAGARRAARLAAVQALYQMELGGANADQVVAEFDRHRLGKEIEGVSFGEADRKLFGDLVRGVALAHSDLDSMLAACLNEDWKVERLEAVLRAILRAAAYELSERHDVPPRVVITEYVDLADAFFSGKEPALVNGVLDCVARAIRPDELGSGGGRSASSR